MNDKRVLSNSDLLKHLKEQNDFLISDIDKYVKGQRHFGVKIATSLRTIFHNTAMSKAILPDLADNYEIPITFRIKHQPKIREDNLTLYLGFSIGSVPMTKDYFDAPFFINSNFENYWNAMVFKIGSTIYTRKQMILYAANKAGGAHVDPEIPSKFLQLTQDGGIKLISRKYDEEMVFCRVAYETGIQVIFILEDLIPILDSKINS